MRGKSLLALITIVFLAVVFPEAAESKKKRAPTPKQVAKVSAPAPSLAPLIVRSADAALSKEEDARLRRQARAVFGQLPKEMPGAENDTPEQIELGRRLYFENALSLNGTQSCNTCHRVDGIHGGADGRPTSLGVHGKPGSRNSPGVLNAGFQVAQFWDGRAPDLAEQAKGPVLNPVEMAIPDENTAMLHLSRAGYEPLFAKAFPGVADPFTFDRMAQAIGAFERTLVTESRLDRYVGGDSGALSPLEKRGLSLFVNTGCLRCHSGPMLGGMLYQKLGVAHPFATTDKGREAVTRDPSDRYAFKVPVLRNIAITGPYFHSGEVATLAEAIDLMGWHQLDRRYTNQEIDLIARFFTALSDVSRTTARPVDVKAPGLWAAPAMTELPADAARAELVRYGYDLVTDTHRYLGAAGAGQSGNQLACRNCHQESGTKVYGIPWMGVSGRYPRHSDRTGKTSSLEDRVNECMQRSMNGNALDSASREMRAIVAYMDWLSAETPAENAGLLLARFDPPDRRADLQRGEEVFAVACQNCHGAKGQGYRAISARAGEGWVAPPLAGPGSYNDGAGMARVLTAAALIHGNMPLGASWDHPVISTSDAFDVAAYVNSLERPQLASKAADYPDRMKKPIDAPYGPYADPFTEEQHRYGPFQPIRAWYEEHKAAAK